MGPAHATTRWLPLHKPIARRHRINASTHRRLAALKLAKELNYHSAQVEAYITANGELLSGSVWEDWVEEEAAAQEGAGKKPPFTTGGSWDLRRLFVYMQRKLDPKVRSRRKA